MFPCTQLEKRHMRSLRTPRIPPALLKGMFVLSLCLSLPSFSLAAISSLPLRKHWWLLGKGTASAERAHGGGSGTFQILQAPSSQEAPPGAIAHHSMLAGQKQWQGSGLNPRDLGAGLYPLSQQGRLSGNKTGLFFKEPHSPLALGGLDVSSSPNGPWRRLGATQVMLGEVYSRKASAYKLSGSRSGV